MKAIKQIRADLNKEFKEVEQQRKTVKEKILEPYMQFEGVYKTYISDKYKEADIFSAAYKANNLKQMEAQ